MWWHNKRQQAYLKTDSEVMRDYLSCASINQKLPAKANNYLAVDLEMTGLNKQTDSILSIGFVPIHDGEVIIDKAQHFFIQQDDIKLGQSVTIHGIHPKDIANGVSAENAMSALLKALREHIIVLHNANLDLGFLTALSKKLYGVPLHAETIDTMRIEHKLLKRKNYNVASLRLDDSRQRYGLPRYAAHNAVVDAIATAELWLAQMTKISKKNKLSTQYFLKLSN